MNGYPYSAHVTTSSVLTQVQATISDLESFNGLFKEATVPSQGLAQRYLLEHQSDQITPLLQACPWLTSSHRGKAIGLNLTHRDLVEPAVSSPTPSPHTPLTNTTGLAAVPWTRNILPHQSIRCRSLFPGLERTLQAEVTAVNRSPDHHTSKQSTDGVETANQGVCCSGGCRKPVV